MHIDLKKTVQGGALPDPDVTKATAGPTSTSMIILQNQEPDPTPPAPGYRLVYYCFAKGD